MNIALPAITLGWVIALIGLILVVVFFAIGTLPALLAVLFGMAFLSRLT